MSDLTEKEIGKRLAQGRGTGDREKYVPFLDVHDLSSDGLVSRIPSLKTGRTHHLFSQIESRAFREFIRLPQVVDLKEQYPLDREVTRGIAHAMGVSHPCYRNGVHTVMTTDMIVVVASEPAPTLYARAGKSTGDLCDRRTLEKLEIERRYWQLKGVHWSLLTELDFVEERATNLEWMHGMETLPEGSHPSYWPDRIDAFRNGFEKARDITFADLERRLVRHNLQVGEMLSIIRHLAWAGELTFDLDQTFDVNWPTAKLKMVKRGSRRRSA